MSLRYYCRNCHAGLIEVGKNKELFNQWFTKMTCTNYNVNYSIRRLMHISNTQNYSVV